MPRLNNAKRAIAHALNSWARWQGSRLAA